MQVDEGLEDNQDPSYLRDLRLSRPTVEGQKAIAATALSRREIIRWLGTSPAQLYRLLDQTNYRNSVDRSLGACRCWTAT